MNAYDLNDLTEVSVTKIETTGITQQDKATVTTKIKQKEIVMDTIKASVYWNGGYISNDTQGLKGKELDVQKRLIKALKNGEKSVITKACDELPIGFRQ